MDLSGLQTFVGDLTNDPNHDRYTTAKMGTEFDNVMDEWNVKARILKDTITITTVDRTRQYALSNLTGTPIAFSRVTHKGIELKKKDKAWMDMFAGDDWTDDNGTPKYFIVEATDPDVQQLTVYPIPGSGDAGANLVVEYIKRHASMSASTDTPFMSGTTVQGLLRPYDYGIGYQAAAKLLLRDPSPENAQKALAFQKIANGVLADVVQVFKALEKEEPMRLRGGRGPW